MAENKTVDTVEPTVPQSNIVKGFRDLLKEPIVQDLVIPVVKKEYLGIGGHEKNVIKGAGGRFLYGLRDLIQGTWWAVAAFSLIMGFGFMILFLLYLKLRQMLGV